MEVNSRPRNLKQIAERRYNASDQQIIQGLGKGSSLSALRENVELKVCRHVPSLWLNEPHPKVQTHFLHVCTLLHVYVFLFQMYMYHNLSNLGKKIDRALSLHMYVIF